MIMKIGTRNKANLRNVIGISKCTLYSIMFGTLIECPSTIQYCVRLCRATFPCHSLSLTHTHTQNMQRRMHDATHITCTMRRTYFYIYQPTTIDKMCTDIDDEFIRLVRFSIQHVLTQLERIYQLLIVI